MLLGRQLGNPFSSLVNSVARVAGDSRVQAVTSAAASQYAPAQYAQAQRSLVQAQQILRAGQPGYNPNAVRGRAGPQMMPARPMQPQGYPAPAPYPDSDDDGNGGAGTMATGPVQKGNLLLIAGAAGAGLILLMLLRK